MHLFRGIASRSNHQQPQHHPKNTNDKSQALKEYTKQVYNKEHHKLEPQESVQEFSALSRLGQHFLMNQAIQLSELREKLLVADWK
jgi:hypothetical protein